VGGDAEEGNDLLDVVHEEVLVEGAVLLEVVSELEDLAERFCSRHLVSLLYTSFLRYCGYHLARDAKTYMRCSADLRGRQGAWNQAVGKEGGGGGGKGREGGREERWMTGAEKQDRETETETERERQRQRGSERERDGGGGRNLFGLVDLLASPIVHVEHQGVFD
jgi:hypothetical protein